jgi:plasmid stability protein
MANLSIRGLDDDVLVELKKRAAQEDASVNTLVVRLIEQALGRRRVKTTLQRYDDLDDLAGSWRKSDAAAFERATAPFTKVDAKLWASAPRRRRSDPAT